MTAWAGGKGSEARAVDRQRFNDNWDKIWGKKTMDKDQILEVLYNSIATVTFTKLDGTVRVLKGTLQEEFLPVKETDDSGVDVETIAEAQKDLVEQRRGKDILQTKITTMRYEREKMAALLEMAKAKEANLSARKKAADVLGDGDIDMDNLTKSIYSRLDKADASLKESENTLENSIDDAIKSDKVDADLEERRKKLGLS